MRHTWNSRYASEDLSRKRKEGDFQDSRSDQRCATAADVVRAMHQATNPGDEEEDEDSVRITVSFDGTWQKRGHTSMHGVAAVIDVITLLVVDYEVLSMYCHSCSCKKAEFGADSPAFIAWYAEHQDDCSVNYHGSSNAMEVEAAKRLWERSVRNYGLMYTGMLGDGDSKAYQAVVEIEPYGPDIPIVQEECVNHAHKRMGTALLKLAKKEKLGGHGRGRLTKDKAMRLQQYYRYAITASGGDTDNMRDRVWATLFHCMSTDEEPHHTRCPRGTNSCCFYQRALATDEEPPSHELHIKHPLAHDVAEAMVPVYRHMSVPNLLKRLAKGKTQNSNESLHSVIWSRCSKTVFVSHRKLQGAVARAVACFNAGASHLTEVMELLAIEVNELNLAFVDECDRQLASMTSAKKDRKRRGEERKRKRAYNEEQEGPSYVAGAF